MNDDLTRAHQDDLFLNGDTSGSGGHPEFESTGAYVLDALTPVEAADFELHLRACATCRNEVAALRQVVDVLPLALDPIEPPATLRSRLLAAVEGSEQEAPAPRLTALPGGRPAPRSAETSSRRWLPITTVAAAALIAGLGVWNLELHSQLNNKSSPGYAAAVAQALAGGAHVYQVGGTGAMASAHAAMVQPRNGHNAYLVVTGLPPAPHHKIYQLWLMSAAKPRSVAIFAGSGNATSIVPLSRGTAGYTRTGVTIEPGPHGSPLPTTSPVMLGSLGA